MKFYEMIMESVSSDRTYAKEGWKHIYDPSKYQAKKMSAEELHRRAYVNGIRSAIHGRIDRMPVSDESKPYQDDGFREGKHIVNKLKASRIDIPHPYVYDKNGIQKKNKEFEKLVEPYITELVSKKFK